MVDYFVYFQAEEMSQLYRNVNVGESTSDNKLPLLGQQEHCFRENWKTQKAPQEKNTDMHIF
jgi:hypothetical protein